MSPIRFYSMLLAGACLLLPGAINAADDSENAGRVSGHMGIKDEAFIRKAAQDGMTEMQLGELAVQRGKRDDVKKMGALMVTDHGKVNDDIKQIASKAGITLPEQLDTIHAGVIDRIGKLEQDQFDKAYIDEMIKDHKEDVSGLQDEMKTTGDSGIKAFIAKTLPVIKAHLAHVQKLAGASPQ